MMANLGSAYLCNFPFPFTRCLPCTPAHYFDTGAAVVVPAAVPAVAAALDCSFSRWTVDDETRPLLYAETR